VSASRRLEKQDDTQIGLGSHDEADDALGSLGHRSVFHAEGAVLRRALRRGRRGAHPVTHALTRRYGRRFAALWSIEGLVVMVIAIVVGAWLYREDSTSAAATRA
jgi:hypothetical protein